MVQLGMKFPVDLLADVGQAELEQSAHTYMENLLYSNPYAPELLALSDSTQTPIDISRVGFAPLYGSNNKQKILALFPPSDPLTAVALYLLGRWWTVEDVLKTGDPSRDGAVEVRTIGERIVLYVLNRVIYRAKEMNADELPFLCHGEKDYAKILWKDGEAVGFYSVKAAGTFWNIYSTRRYQIPVMDSIFVRKNHRGQGLGLKMLQDYVLSFKENSLGLRYPLPTSMYKVCKKYLCQYPEDEGLLWEVESVGEPNQRTNLSSKIHAMDLSAVSKSLSFTEEPLGITTEAVMDLITTQIKEDGLESTVEIVEEVTVTRTPNETELPDKPQGRSSVIRIEDIEAETPNEKQDLSQQTEEMPVNDGTTEAEAATTIVSEDKHDIESAPLAGQPQTEDDTKQSNASHESQIIVENVASEIEETNEDLKGSNAELRFSEETVEQQEEMQTLGSVGKGIVVESTVTTTTITTTYTRHYQKEFAESDKVDEVTEEKVVSVAEVIEKLDGSVAEEPKESAAIKGEDEYSTVGDQQELEMEPLTNEIEKDQQEASVLNESASVLSGTTDDVGTEGTGVEQEKQVEEDVAPDVDDEEVPPVVQRRSLRVRYKVVSKGRKGDNANEANVETEYSDTNEKVVEQMKKRPLVDENIQFDIDKTQQGLTLEKINVDQECVSSAEEATGSITTVTEVLTKECKVVLEHAKPETVSLLEEEADDVAHDSPAVPADPVGEELQDLMDTVCKVPKLHQATVVLVDFKLAGPRFAEKSTVENPAQEERPTLDKDQAKLIAPEEEQVLNPDVMMVVEELDEGKMVNSEEISTAVATEGEIDDNHCHNKDTADAEKSGDAEVPFVDTRVLRSGRKTVKVNKGIQECEEDDTGNSNPEVTSVVLVEEGDFCELLEADSTVADGKGNLSPTETDEESSQEPSQVSTRASSSKTKSTTGKQVHTKTRKQGHKRAESDNEEPMTTTVTLRSKRRSYTDTPRQLRKQNKNKAVKVSDLPETEGKSEEVIEEAQHVNLESEENIEPPDERCDVASEGEAADETTDIEKDKEQQVKEVDGQNTEQEVAVPAADSAASEQENELCTLKKNPELLQEEAVEDQGHKYEAIREIEDEEDEKQEPVALPEEQCCSSAVSVPEEDTNVSVQQDEDGLARVEETLIEDSGVLERGDDTVITTDKSKSIDIGEDESTAGEEGAKDEVTVGTRKRRRSAPTTPRRKSKRVGRQSKKEEKEDSTSAEESQEEGPKAELEDIQEECGEEKTKKSVENRAEVLTEDGTRMEEDQEQEKEISKDRNTINDPTVEARVLRKRRSTAAATPRRTSKRVRSELKEAPKITVESSEPEDESVIAETITEESHIVPLVAQETQPVALEASQDEQKETNDEEHSREETATDDGKAVNDEVPPGAQTKEEKHLEIQDVVSTTDPAVGPDCACTEDLEKDEDQEVTGVDGQSATEEQHEALSETEANTPLEEGNEENTVRINEENEHTPVIITRSLRSGTKTTSFSTSSRFRRENLKEKGETPTESSEEQNVTDTVKEVPDLGPIVQEGENEVVAGVQIQAQAEIAGSIPEGSSGEDLSKNISPPLSNAQNINDTLVDQDEPTDAEKSSSEIGFSTKIDEANKNEIVENKDIPGPGSAASDLDDQQCTSETTPELLQDEAIEEVGLECEAVSETDEREKQKPVLPPGEQCSSSVDLVPGEDANVLDQQDEEGLVGVEETPVESSEVLKSSDNIVITTEEGKAMEIDEGTAGEECVRDEQTVGTWKRRRSATTTPRRKSKRASRQSKTEEKEDSTSAEESQEEGPRAELEDIKEESGGEKTEENENKAQVLAEDSSEIEEHQEQDKEVSEDRNTVDEPTVETRVLRKRRSAAGATPRRTSKRVRSELKEAPKITEESSEPEDESVTADTFTEELPIVPLMAQETQPGLLVTSEDKHKATNDGEQSREETATDDGKAADDEAPSGTRTKDDKQQGAKDVMSTTDSDVRPDSACTEEESPVLDMSEMTEDQVPTVTSRSLRSKTKTSPAKPSHNPGKVDEHEEPQLNEDLAEAIKLDCEEEAKDVPLVELLAGDDSEDRAEETADLTGKSIADIAENSEENLESEEATSGSVEEDEDEDEWSMSEEEAIVIGSRVLRGRTVPSLVITPHSTPRRHTAKVQMSEENCSPVHKKKSTGLTPASGSKRRSRV